MESPVILFEDMGVDAFWPITVTRPLWALRVGMLRIFEKWETSLRTSLFFYTTRRKILASFLRRTRNTREVPPGTRGIWINARLLPPETSEIELLFEGLAPGDRLVDEQGRLMIGYLEHEDFLQAFMEGTSGHPLPGGFHVLRSWGDVFRFHREQFFFDDMRLEMPRELQGEFHQAPTVLGDALHIAPGAKLEGPVVLDSRNGPIHIGEHVRIEPFTIIEGPVFVGNHSVIRSHSHLRDTAVGSTCKIGGEIHASIFQEFSNKQHTGFLGNSYVGSWVNIGAGATTSNLKNTYGPVRLLLPTGEENTETQFLGAILGDHVKIGIQAALSTGTVIGVGTVYARTTFSPKLVPSFVLLTDERAEEFRIDKALEVARRMMERRHVLLTEEEASVLRHVFEQEKSLRDRFLETGS